ncbi:MAG: 5'/3'-nucleotidase SurE, partial [Desulfuromonadaceae bacterium]
MRILVTNDDGVLSPGLEALVRSLSALGTVTVVAPDRERSAVGHSLTLHSPLRVDQLRPEFYAVDGTPTYCINLALHWFMAHRPNIVVSGIYRGG